MSDLPLASTTIELPIILNIEDDWPPVAIEYLPCTPVAEGYLVEMPPLFVKGLSVNDVISVSHDSDGNVESWVHVRKSNRTTIWLLRIAKSDDIGPILKELRLLNCNTVQLQQFGCYSVDVPEDCAIQDVDACLARLDQSSVAVAYPSFRHKDC